MTFEDNPTSGAAISGDMVLEDLVLRTAASSSAE